MMESLNTVIISYAVTFGAGFAVGATVGWYLTAKKNVLSEKQFRRVIAVTITTMWTYAIVADILISGYDAPILVHAVMGAVAGFLFSEDGLDIQVGGK